MMRKQTVPIYHHIQITETWNGKDIVHTCQLPDGHTGPCMDLNTKKQWYDRSSTEGDGAYSSVYPFDRDGRKYCSRCLADMSVQGAEHLGDAARKCATERTHLISENALFEYLLNDARRAITNSDLRRDTLSSK